MKYEDYITHIYHFFDQYIGSKQGSYVEKHNSIIKKYKLFPINTRIISVGDILLNYSHIQKFLDHCTQTIRIQKTQNLIYLYKLSDHQMTFTLEIKHNYIIFTYINSGYGINLSPNISITDGETKFYNLWDTHYIKIISDAATESEQVVNNIGLIIFFIRTIDFFNTKIITDIIPNIIKCAIQIDEKSEHTKKDRTYEKIWQKCMDDKLYEKSNNNHDVFITFFIFYDEKYFS